MDSRRVTYCLKRFRSSSDPDFASVLLLYVRNTAGPIRTESNQITAWLDKPPEDFAGQFYVFGFYANEQLIAFAEASYFSAAGLLMFDYIVIDEMFRKNNTFFEFVDHLRQFFENTHPEYRYVVAEVGYGPGEQFPNKTAQLIQRLLKLQGFRVIKAPYFQPRLILTDAETEMRADLLLFTVPPIEHIPRDAYIRIVRTIYYDYYLPWMQATTSSGDAYRRHLDGVMKRVEAGLKHNMIVVNGHGALLQASSTRGNVTAHKAISFPIQALLVIVVLTASLLELRAVFHLTDYSFTLIYLLAVLSYMAVAGVVSKSARAMFAEVAQLFRDVFYRRGDGSKPSALPTARRGRGGRISP